MSSVQCLKKSSCEMYEKFSAKNLLKLVKVVKPVLKLMKRKQRTNAVTPSSCNYDVVESFQNDLNESELYRLDFKFFDDVNEAEENLKNEELERQLLKVREVATTEWTPCSDRDICKRQAQYLTHGQRAERQTPAATA